MCFVIALLSFVLLYGSEQPAKALDDALQTIAARYGMGTAKATRVAMKKARRAGAISRGQNTS
jgi:hypothetical protein